MLNDFGGGVEPELEPAFSVAYLRIAEYLKPEVVLKAEGLARDGGKVVFLMEARRKDMDMVMVYG